MNDEEKLLAIRALNELMFVCNRMARLQIEYFRLKQRSRFSSNEETEAVDEKFFRSRKRVILRRIGRKKIPVVEIVGLIDPDNLESLTQFPRSDWFVDEWRDMYPKLGYAKALLKNMVQSKKRNFHVSKPRTQTVSCLVNCLRLTLYRDADHDQLTPTGFTNLSMMRGQVETICTELVELRSLIKDFPLELSTERRRGRALGVLDVIGGLTKNGWQIEQPYLDLSSLQVCNEQSDLTQVPASDIRKRFDLSKTSRITGQTRNQYRVILTWRSYQTIAQAVTLSKPVLDHSADKIVLAEVDVLIQAWSVAQTRMEECFAEWKTHKRAVIGRGLWMSDHDVAVRALSRPSTEPALNPVGNKKQLRNDWLLSQYLDSPKDARVTHRALEQLLIRKAPQHRWSLLAANSMGAALREAWLRQKGTPWPFDGRGKKAKARPQKAK